MGRKLSVEQRAQISLANKARAAAMTPKKRQAIGAMLQKARQALTTSAERSAIARHAAAVRWSRPRPEKKASATKKRQAA